MRLLSFDIHASFLAFLPVLIEKFQKLDHLVIDQIIMHTRVEFSLIEQSKELIKSDHLFRVKNNAIQQIIIEDLHCCLLTE